MVLLTSRSTSLKSTMPSTVVLEAGDEPTSLRVEEGKLRSTGEAETKAGTEVRRTRGRREAREREGEARIPAAALVTDEKGEGGQELERGGRTRESRRKARRLRPAKRKGSGVRAAVAALKQGPARRRGCTLAVEDKVRVGFVHLS